MTTTPFEEHPDPTPDEGTAADPGTPRPGEGGDPAAQDRSADDPQLDELMPDSTPFRTPDPTRDA